MMFLQKQDGEPVPPPVRFHIELVKFVSSSRNSASLSPWRRLAVWFELQYFCRSSGVGVLLSSYIDHAELVVSLREFVIPGCTFEKRTASPSFRVDEGPLREHRRRVGRQLLRYSAALVLSPFFVRLREGC